jgi:hypothetical protein
LTVLPEQLATATTPRELALPVPILEEVGRTGLDAVSYSVAVCGGEKPSVGDVAHSTGFVDLDHLLDAKVVEFGLELPASGCVTSTIYLRGFSRACE